MEEGFSGLELAFAPLPVPALLPGFGDMHTAVSGVCSHCAHSALRGRWCGSML